ncbi:PH domain-containing protein [Pseudorhodoferax sp.]|uniref:PH domain-containing protein n=1 Tax=Pseudorhodoferax sp. TaxID=1993553 RepID=UPI0039E5D791
MRFASKVDLWLVLVLGAAALAVLWALARALAHAGSGGIAVAAVAAALAVGLPLWLLVDTRYELADGQLRVRCGPFRSAIALDQIRSVRPSRSLVSSPALSLDRLHIAYGRHQAVLVSPRDKAGFIAALQQQAPGVQVLHP